MISIREALFPRAKRIARINPVLALVIFVLFLLVTLWGLVLQRLEVERVTALEQARSNAEGFAHAFREHTLRVLRQVDQATQFIKLEFERNGGNGALASLSARSGLLPTELATVIAIADEHGNITQSAQPFSPTNIADREHFKALINDTSGRLFVGTPVLGRISKRWAVPLTRRLEHADGSFAGVITISIDPAFLTAFYEDAVLGDNGMLVLVGLDHSVRASRIGEQVAFGQRLDLGQVFSRFDRLYSGALIAGPAGDTEPRIVAYRGLNDYSLITLAGVSEAEALSDFYRHRTSYLTALTIVSLVVVGFTIGLSIQGLRLQRSRVAALQAQETYRAASDGSLDAFFILVSERGERGMIKDFVVADCNQRSEGLFARTREACLGRALRELLPVTRWDAVFHRYVKVAESGQTLEEEIVLSGAGETAEWLEHQIVRVGDGIAVTTRNITERKRQELARQRSDERFRLMIDNLVDYAVFMLDANGKIASWNAGAQRMYGYTADEVLGCSWDMFLTPELCAAGTDSRLLGTAAGNGRSEHEGERLRKDGSRFSVAAIVTAMRDVSGELIGFVKITRDVTESLRQTHELRAAHAELQAVNDASPLGMFRTDARGHCSYVNRTYEQITGISRGAALGDGWSAALYPEDKMPVFQAWDGAVRHGLPFEGSYRFRRPDGSIVWVSCKAAPIVVEGQLAGYAGTLDDITERRASDEARRMLAAILEASTDFVATTDFSGNVRYMNPAARRLCGLSPETDITGTTLSTYFPGWVVERLIKEAVPAASKHGVWVGETAVCDFEGNEIPINHLVIAQMDAGGRVEFFASIMRDISEAKQAEQALRASEERLRMVTDNMPALISYLDRDLRFRFANEAYRAWVGIAPAELIGKSLLEVYGEEVFALARPHAETALAGRAVTYEREMVCAGGIRRHVVVSMVPQCDADGEVAGLYVLINDISERTAAEHALRRSEEQLRTISDALPMLISCVDAEQRYRHVNLGYEREFGLSRNEIVGRHVSELIGEAEYRTIEPHIRTVLSGTAVKFEKETVCRGRFLWVEGTFMPQRAEDGHSVTGYYAVWRNITAEKLEARRLLKLSEMDSLTGLSNRAGFDQALILAMERSAASGNLMALLFLDVDYFKQVNDRYGHVTGDALLKAFAGRVRESVHGRDTVARLGGDEFAVILEKLGGIEDAERVAGNILDAVRAPFALHAELKLAVTTSIGIAFYQGDTPDPSELLRRADEMLYAAKASGRNCFHCLRPALVDA